MVFKNGASFDQLYHFVLFYKPLETQSVFLYKKSGYNLSTELTGPEAFTLTENYRYKHDSH